ncbi:MAG: hypothetical protein HOI23_09150 [Deltaproteobacteria bacterium]|jgi:hypothetical protein|nr:hypothetical protein [Deltaproteobacteria bacterium]MBT6432381.1 hypothetical protein [Deltaproteobacteria bacterium]MBT6488798.1 hypothetical protein [Deltaproteobacteria bacterium]
MTSLVLIVCALLCSAESRLEEQGVLELRRLPGKVQVLLKVPDTEQKWVLTGDVLPQLRKLQSATVRVRGMSNGKEIVVETYDLLSVYGKTPIVGQITEISGKIALIDGDGPPILLNLAPRSYRRFLEARGQRSWVIGKLLLSGEFKVGRYGIFAKPVIKPTDSPADETEKLK